MRANVSSLFFRSMAFVYHMLMARSKRPCRTRRRIIPYRKHIHGLHRQLSVLEQTSSGILGWFEKTCFRKSTQRQSEQWSYVALGRWGKIKCRPVAWIGCRSKTFQIPYKFCCIVDCSSVKTVWTCYRNSQQDDNDKSLLNCWKVFFKTTPTFQPTYSIIVNGNENRRVVELTERSWLHDVVIAVITTLQLQVR